MKTLKGENTKQQQIISKLANVHNTNELKQIYRGLDDQNRILQSDIASLKQKVEVLLERQKAKLSQNNASVQNTAKELANQQKELKSQYKIMQELKKRMQSEQQNKPTQQLSQNYDTLINSIKGVQNQISLTKTTIADLKNETLHLQKTLSQYEEEAKRNQPKLNEFAQENVQLRRKILSLRKISVEREYESAKVMNSMYSVKARDSKIQEMQKMKLMMSKVQVVKKEIIDVAGLEKEVQSLKREVEKISLLKMKNEAQLAKRKEELDKSNKQEMKRLKEMEERRNRLVWELNKFKRRWENHIENKNKNKQAKDYVSTQAQSDQYQDSEPFLRRDFAGVLGGRVRFDDRMALRDNKKSFIVGFYVYQMEIAVISRSILTAVRAIYDSQSANELNHVPLPGQYLSKCKLSKYMFEGGDFIKVLKIKYNSVDNRVLKLQIRTNKNMKYEFGDKRNFSDIVSGQNVYGFDISINEFPVSLFGSYTYIKSHWYLESLGVEITELPAGEVK